MQMLLAMVLLTACNNDDDNNQAKNTGPGPLAEELSAGTWYNIYEATGVAHAEGAREESMAYSVVADVYHFNTDGTGDFQRCFFGDDDDDILVQGILGYGVFNYSSTADGKVHITLTHQWDQSYPQQWDVSYANEAVDDKELDKQTKGHITGPNGVEAPLWVQDYWGKSSRDGKDDAVIRMLEAAANRDMNAESPAWVINFPSAYFGLPLSDSYRENAVEANKVTADWLASHTGSVGIIYMDFAGMDKTPGYASLNLYDTHGMTLVDCVIKQNMK